MKNQDYHFGFDNILIQMSFHGTQMKCVLASWGHLYFLGLPFKSVGVIKYKLALSYNNGQHLSIIGDRGTVTLHSINKQKATCY